MEDDPYYFLHPDRAFLDSFLSLDTEGRVVRFDSMSQLLSPGLRVGFVTGPGPLMERLDYHVQATNLHSSGLSQTLVQKLMQSWGVGGFEAHSARAATFYSRRRDVLLGAARRHLGGGLAEWNSPDAGMFLCIKLLDGITDARYLIEERAAEARVLLVPGQSFDPLDRPSPYVRASFSTATDEEIELEAGGAGEGARVMKKGRLRYSA